jgi:iron complex transport system substrate-binding protein
MASRVDAPPAPREDPGRPSRRRRAALALGLAATLAGMPGLALAEPIAVRDDTGATVSLSAPAQRIVSLLPSLTETVCALGACARLVGTDRHSNWPASVASLPKLGGMDDAQVERIVALRPDLVLAARSTRATDRLRSLGLAVVALDSDSHADVQRSLATIARLLALPDAAEATWQRIEREVQQAARRVPAAWQGRRVYFEVSSTPYAAGTASFIGQTLARLGLGNVVPAELGAFARLNPEYVVRHPPDVLMAPAREVRRMTDRPGWRSVPALAAGRVCGFDGPTYELLIRPGPRLGEAAAAMADCLAGLPPPA